MKLQNIALVVIMLFAGWAEAGSRCASTPSRFRTQKVSNTEYDFTMGQTVTQLADCQALPAGTAKEVAKRQMCFAPYAAAEILKTLKQMGRYDLYSAVTKAPGKSLEIAHYAVLERAFSTGQLTEQLNEEIQKFLFDMIDNHKIPGLASSEAPGVYLQAQRLLNSGGTVSIDANGDWTMTMRNYHGTVFFLQIDTCCASTKSATEFRVKFKPSGDVVSAEYNNGSLRCVRGFFTLDVF